MFALGWQTWDPARSHELFFVEAVLQPGMWTGSHFSQKRREMGPPANSKFALLRIGRGCGPPAKPDFVFTNPAPYNIRTPSFVYKRR